MRSKAIAAAVSAQKKAGSTRSGQLSGYRLLRGGSADTARSYLLELEGMMSLPAGIATAIGTASAGTVSQDSFNKVGGRERIRWSVARPRMSPRGFHAGGCSGSSGSRGRAPRSARS